MFDTGSDWLAIGDSTCTECATSGASQFDTSSSSSYSLYSATNETQAYGSATFYCYEATDNVYLDSGESFGITDFEFYLVTQETGMPDSTNGLMGMCRKYTDSAADFTTGPIYY